MVTIFFLSCYHQTALHMRKQHCRIALLAGLLLAPFINRAQTISDTLKYNGYLYENFINGSVLLHKGSTENAPLNYNTNTQEIAFRQNDQVMVLSNPDDVDTVYIQDKKFIPIRGKFYAVATTTAIPLLVTYTNYKRPITTTVDHNGTSKQLNQEVSNTVSETYLNRRYQGQFVLEFHPSYWLKRGNSLYKANNEKQIVKVFPPKEEAIKAFIQTNNVHFERENEVAKLVEAIQ